VSESQLFRGRALSGLQIEDGLVHGHVPHCAGVDLSDQFRISIIMKAAAVDGYRTLLWKGDRTGKPERVQYWVDLRDGKIEFKAKRENGDWVLWITKEPCVAENRWALLRVAFNAGVCRIELNGVERPVVAPAAGDTPLQHLVGNTDPLRFGLGETAAGNPGYPFSGVLAEVSFARSADAPDGTVALARIAYENLMEHLAAEARTTQATLVQLQQLRSRLLGDLPVVRPKLEALVSSEGGAWLRQLQDLAEFMHRVDFTPGSPTEPPGAVGVFPGETTDLLRALETGMQALLAGEQALRARLEKSPVPTVGNDATAMLTSLQAKLERDLERLRGPLSAWLSRVEAQRREAALFARGNQFAAVPCSAGITLDRSRTALSRIPENNGPVTLHLARNEREGLQFLLLPRPRLQGKLVIAWSAGAFTQRQGMGVLPAPEIAPMKTVNNRRTTLPVDYRGEIFDIIMDGQNRAVAVGEEPTVVFVRFRTVPDTAPGVYHGTLAFTADGETHTVAMEIVVSDFTLPEHSSLRVAFSFAEARYRTWFPAGAADDAASRRIAEFMQAYRLAPNDIYHPGVFPDPKRFPRAIFYTLGYLGRHGSMTPAEVKQAVATLKNRWRDARAAGFPAERIYLYSWDEYGTFFKSHFDPETVRQFMELVRVEIPELKRMQTSVPRPAFADWWNVWVPLISDFRRVDPAVFRTPGAEAWWYWVSDPRPYPNFFLGNPAHESRMALLIGFKYRLKGCLYWCINREWTENASQAAGWPATEWDPGYLNSLSGKENTESGQGNLCYPGTEGRLWPSLRLENVRDGIEDFEYLTLLDRRAAEIRGGKRPGKNQDLSAVEAVLALPDDVVASTSRWTRDPIVLAAFRERLATLLEGGLDAARD
jgi:hypothetical protein